jgi:CRP/FNR family transcriptional regulator, cyclic AMP receptor protein
MISARDALKNTWLFSDLTDEERLALEKVMTSKNIPIHGFVLSEAKVNDSLWILAKGSLEVHISLKKVGELRDGEMFGEQSWLEGLPATASIVANQESAVWRIKFKDLDDVMGDFPEAHIQVLRKLAINLSQRLRSRA